MKPQKNSLEQFENLRLINASVIQGGCHPKDETDKDKVATDSRGN